jgi:Ca2+-binding EF-hand superfamily protein
MKTLSQIRELISEKKKHEEKMCDDCGKTSKACECSDMKEELSAKQKQLDKNHNGKLDKQDFEMLRSMKNKGMKSHKKD